MANSLVRKRKEEGYCSSLLFILLTLKLKIMEDFDFLSEVHQLKVMGGSNVRAEGGSDLTIWICNDTNSRWKDCKRYCEP